MLEKDRFGGEDRGAVGTVVEGWGAVEGVECFGAGFSSPATVS